MRAKILDELIPTDRILLRWARSVGDGLYDCPWEDVPFNRAPELDDQTAIVVDQLVLRAPCRKLVELWYRTNLPPREISRRLRCDEDVLPVRFNAALWHFKGHFESSPLSSLRRLCVSDIADRTRIVYTESVKWAYCHSGKPAA
jgi:hypothetical protein